MVQEAKDRAPSGIAGLDQVLGGGLPRDRVYLVEGSILVLAQHGHTGGRLASPVDLSYIADTVLLFRHFEYGGEVRKALAVGKRRSGPHENTIRELRITGSGLQVGEPLREFEGVLSGEPRYVGEMIRGAEGRRPRKRRP